MTEIFAGSELKIARARKHVIEFEQYVADHMDAHPPKVTTRERTDPADEWSALNTHVEVKVLPPEAGAIIGDVIHNLRAALDIMAVSLVGAVSTDTENVYFPFCTDANELDKMIKRRGFDRAGQDAVDLLKQFAPHRGGNEALRALHELDIQDKHHMVIPILANISSPPSRVEIDESVQPRRVRLVPLDYDPKTLFAPSFPDNSFLAHREVIPTLHELVSLVEGILKAFAALVAARA